ncbi:hypothetical protein [Maribacter sp.]
MKRIIFLLFFGICMVHLVKAQVKIGENPQSLDGASVLELESTDKVLVITRVSTAEMNAITPLQGALVYNTDVQSVHYYDGTQWVNIGGGGSTDGPLTADPIVNDISTIVITPTGTGNNLEVAENSIGTTQIRDFSINGTEDILDGSIGTGKFGEDVITQFELSENSVGPIELDNANIGVSAFTNDVGYITSANVVSLDGGNALQVGTDDGAYYDETPLINAIQDNTDAINLDNDANPNNEIQNLQLNGNDLTISGSNTVTLPSTTGEIDDNELITDAVLNGTDLVITEAGTDFTVSLASLSGGGGSTEVADQTTITGVGTAGDPFKIEPGGNGQFLTTDGTGAVSWETVTPGGGTTEVVDGTLLTGAGTAGDPFTIAPGGADQILRTNPAGDAVTWVPLPTGGAVISDNTLDGDGSSIATALGLADNAVTLEKIAPNGATTDGQIIQWNTDLDGPGPGTDAGWEVAENTGFLGNNQNNVFFAGPGGVPYDTESNDDGSFPTTRDNGGFFWDSSKRFDTGALYLGLKLNGNGDGTSTIESNPEGHSKLILAERFNAAAPFNLAFPLQLRNESNVADTGAGILFAINRAGNPGKGALVFQRGATESEGDFHFLVSQTNVDERPTFNESVLTVENDGDLLLKGNLADKNGIGATPPTSGATEEGFVLTNTTGGTVWAAPTGGTSVTDTDADDGLSNFVAADGYDINVDDTTIEIVGDALQVKDDGVTSAKIAPNTIVADDINTDAVTSDEILNATILAEDLSAMGATTNGQVLKWNGAVWAPATDNTSGTSVTDTDANDGLSNFVAASGYNINVDGATIELVSDALQIKDDGVTSAKIAPNTIVADDINTDAVTTDEILNATILAEDLSAMGATISGQILKWNGTVWAPGTDNTSGTSVTDSDANDGLTNFGATTGYNINVDDTTIELVSDALQVKDDGITSDKIADGAISGGAGGAIADNSITASDISNDAVDNAEIKSGAVRTGEIFDLTILDEDISPTAAIAGSKVAPDFGGQNITGVTDITVSGSIFRGLTDLHPDYVFQKYFLGSSELKSDYEFKSLQAIEAFVKRYKHLPGIKSAQQVKDEGVWNLSESNIQNLEKIEELFLHTIEQEHKIKTLQSENQNLSEELQSLKRDLEEIKALLKNN